VNASAPGTDASLAAHLAVPYRLTTYAAPVADGSWKRFAEYPELDCTTWADTLVEAMERLEHARVRTIVERLARGEPVPAPRPPLRSLLAELDPDEVSSLQDQLDGLRAAAGAERT
jgi:predicted RNase H-like HicB family nuclease